MNRCFPGKYPRKLALPDIGVRFTWTSKRLRKILILTTFGFRNDSVCSAFSPQNCAALVNSSFDMVQILAMVPSAPARIMFVSAGGVLAGFLKK